MKECMLKCSDKRMTSEAQMRDDIWMTKAEIDAPGLGLEGERGKIIM
jgi:hypothetical protein